MADGQYKFSIGLDNKQLELDVAQAKKAFDSLVKEAQQAGVKIDNIPNPFENIGKSAPQVAQATQQFNGLNVATQQLVRELPAASMGINTFFMAISNNLPIFADQVKNLRQQGTSVAGVLKGIGSALYSWQTGLVLVVTALSMYGKEIGAWISSLFKGKEAINAAKEAQKGLNNAIKENGLGIGDEIVKYKELSNAYKKLGDNMEARKKFIYDNRDAFHDLGIEVRNVADANKALVDGTPAVIASLRAQASAAAARNLAEEAFEKQITAEINAKNIRDGGSNWWDILRSGMSYTPFTGVQVAPSYYKEQRAKAEEQRASDAAKLAEEYWKQSKEYAEQATKALKAAGVTPSDPYTNYDAKALEDATRKLARDAAQARTDANVAAMREGLEREIAAINSNYDAKERAIADRKKDMALKNKDGKLTAEQSAYFGTLYAANNQERKREILEAQKREADRIATMANITRTLQLDAAQSEVDAMKEGEDKVLAEIDLKYRKRREQLENRQRELMKSQNGALTGKQAQMFGQMYENIDQEEANEIEEHNKKKLASFDDYLIEYGTIQEKILATTRKYEREIADAQSEGERKALAAERDATLAVYKAQVSDFAKGLADLSIKEINEMIEDLTVQVEAKQAAFDALDTSDSQEAQDYQKIINELKAKIELLQKESESAKRSLKDKNWAEATQVFQNIGTAATDAADGIAEFDEGLADALRGIAQLASSATNMIGAIQGVMTAFKEGGSVIEKASAILAVAGAAIQAVSTLIALFKGTNEVAEAVKQFKALNAELEVLNRLARIDSVEGTIFGGDSFSNFVNNLDVMRESMTKLQDSTVGAIEKINEAKRTSIETMIARYTGVSAELEAYWRQQLEDLGKETDLTGFIEGIEVQLSRRKKSTLGDMLPELFGDGEVTLDALKKLQNSDVWDKISEGNRDMIDQMIRDWEAYEQATEAVNKYMQDIFGDLGASITDSLVDAFRNGTDAVEAMGDAVGNVVEQIATDMAHAAFIQPLLEQAQDGIEALNKQRSEGGLSDEEYMRELMGITSTLMGNAQDAGEGMAAYLDTMRQMAKEMGIDILESDSAKNSTHARGFQTMSQETGSELNGRFTDIQGQTHRIADAVEFMKGLQVQHTQHMQSVSNTLASIHTNTTLIEQHTRELSSISADINVMRRAIDNGAI